MHEHSVLLPLHANAPFFRGTQISPQWITNTRQLLSPGGSRSQHPITEWHPFMDLCLWASHWCICILRTSVTRHWVSSQRVEHRLPLFPLPDYTSRWWVSGWELFCGLCRNCFSLCTSLPFISLWMMAIVCQPLWLEWDCRLSFETEWRTQHGAGVLGNAPIERHYCLSNGFYEWTILNNSCWALCVPYCVLAACTLVPKALC